MLFNYQERQQLKHKGGNNHVSNSNIKTPNTPQVCLYGIALVQVFTQSHCSTMCDFNYCDLHKIELLYIYSQ